ncbi:peptidylprolyl isomerase [Entamoeba marina]
MSATRLITVQNGNGIFITNRQEVKIQYCIKQGENIEENNNVTFVVGKHEVLPAIEKHIIECQVSGKYQIVGSAASLFGKGGFGNRFNDSCEIVIEVDVLDAFDNNSEKSFESQIDNVKALKEEGKTHITKKQYREAIKVYEKCCGILHTMLDDDIYQGNNVDIRNHLALIHSNIALCYLKLEDYNNTKEQSDEVLKYDPQNAKAFYRIGIALNKKEQFSLALNYLKKSMEFMPDDGLIRREYNNTVRQLHERRSATPKWF